MELFKREKYLQKIRPFYNADDIIKVITGIRRCGKSSIMEMIVDELKSQGVSEENIIWLDLEQREYRKVRDPEKLEALIEEKSNSQGLKFLFIDEVQNVEDFEIVLNGFRAEGNYSIFITGSNSYLLSGELISRLTGRYIEFEVYPLTFDEYVEMKDFYGKPVEDNKLLELRHYLTEGGFPRAVRIDDAAAKSMYTSSVVQEIFEKDIRKKVKIRDRETFELVQNFIINNYGSMMSIKSLCEALRKNGIMTTRATVSRYIKALLDAKVLYECKRFDLKSKRALSNEKKYYLADLSIYYALNTDNRINYGSSLENISYLYARSMDYAVSVGRIGSLECDFVLRNKTNDYAYVQVAYTIALSQETEDREFRPLEKIQDNYSKYVMTSDYLLQKRKGIKHVNLMDFMLRHEVF